MRQEFANRLHELMSENDNIWLVTADLGFGLWDKVRDDFSDRFLNTGASEQAASDICVGLALKGKIPVFYSITPFLIYRCFETWRTYINHESIKVIFIGSGRDDDYKHDGWSHNASDDKLFVKPFVNIHSSWPESSEDMRKVLHSAMIDEKASYINLKR